MPAWPGGPCPGCGDDMPPNLVHCQRCRTLLNEDLHKSSVEIPVFIPLQEIENMLRIQPAGFYVECPRCNQELRIAVKYAGQTVQCKLCSGSFSLDSSNSEVSPHAFYTTCPHCEETLRIAEKYLGMKLACKFCGGKVHFVEEIND